MALVTAIAVICQAPLAQAQTDPVTTGAPAVYGPPAPADTVSVETQVPAGVPSDLAAAVEQMLATYPSIASRRQSARAADSDVDAARWLRFPSVSVEGLSFAGGSDLASANNIGFNLIVEQPIWNNGVVGATIRRAEATRTASEWQLQETAFDLSFAVTQAYFEMVRASRRDRVLNDGRVSLAELAQSITRRVEQDVSPVTDQVLVQSRVAQLDQELAINEAQYLSARERYRQLTGVATAQLGQIPSYDPVLAHPFPEGAFEQAQRCDPKRQRLIAESDSARGEAAIARASLFPQIAAQFSSNEITGNRVGLVLRAQTTGGLSGFAAASGARSRAQASALLVDVNDREARDRLAQDFVENIAAQGRVASNEAAAAAAASVVASYRRQFVAGRRTWLDVVNAVREAYGAELSRVDTEVTAQSSAMRILLRTCRWTTRVES